MNAYFQIINGEQKTELRLVPATAGGKELSVSEVIEYLNYYEIPYDQQQLLTEISSFLTEKTILLCEKSTRPIAGDLRLEISEDNMTATGYFLPPSNDGMAISYEDIMAGLRGRNVVKGILQEKIQEFIKNPQYLEQIPLAVGTAPRHGTDAYIEYFFNTDLKAKPTVLEDGSVDFFNLNIINHCEVDDLLARLHKEDPGEYGEDIFGNRIKPRNVKREVLRFGNNIRISDDRLEIYSKVSGHVSLVDGRVFVSDLMEVENVDTSTGNIIFKGNVQVNGNVNSNFSIVADGNVEVRGVVEGAIIRAGGNITIARGMNGMGKGELYCGGNLIAKFIENSKVESEGYVQAESIIHSEVIAGTDVVVNGKHGFIAGGHVCASTQIDAKILGSEMGTDTIVEVGISPVVKKRHRELGLKIEADRKILERAVPILEAARGRIEAGVSLNEAQIENLRDLVDVVQEKKAALKENKAEYQELDLLLSQEKPAQILVGKTVYPGTKVVISNVSKIIKESIQYCRFIRYKGDVKMESR